MIGKNRLLIYFFLFFVFSTSVYSVDWTYSPGQINIYIFKDLNFSFQLPYLIINGSNVSLDERTLNNTIRNNKVFNVSWADNASSVHCSGIGGAATNLCTITSSLNDQSIYNTANNFTKDYAAEYASTGWKLANDTTAWHELYSVTGYKFTNLSDDVGNSTNITLTTINGRLVATFNMSCQQITGSADLCDGSDATGAAGGQPTTEQIYLNISQYLGNKNASIPNLIDNATFFDSKQSESAAFKITNGTGLPFSNYQDVNATRQAINVVQSNITSGIIIGLSHLDNGTLIRVGNISLWDLSPADDWNKANDSSYFAELLQVNLTSGAVASRQYVISANSSQTTYNEQGKAAYFNKINLTVLGNININTSGIINSTRLGGKLDCSQIDGGTDGDFCTDTSGAGAGNGDGGINFTNWNSTGNLVYANDSTALVGIGTRPVYRLQVDGNATFRNVTIGWNETSPMINLSGSSGNGWFAGTIFANTLNIITKILDTQIDLTSLTLADLINDAGFHSGTTFSLAKNITNNSLNKADNLSILQTIEQAKSAYYNNANNGTNQTPLQSINELSSYNNSVNQYTRDTNNSMLQYVEQSKLPLFTLGQNGTSVVLTTNLKNALGNDTNIRSFQHINITGGGGLNATLWLANESITSNGTGWVCIPKC